MIKTLLRKEILEQLRTHKVLITLAVFFVVGLISPLLAKYTPLLLESIPDLPPGLVDLVPEPTTGDAILQFVQNTSQFGVLLVILINMGTIVQEKERGTAAMLLTKPVRGNWMVLLKWLVGVIILLVGLMIGAAGFFFYTAILFEILPILDFLVFTALLGLLLIVYLSLAILASTLARTQLISAAISFGLLAVMLILGALPRVGDYFPAKLLNWGSSIMAGETGTAWGAVVGSIVIIALALLAACLYFEKQEI